MSSINMPRRPLLAPVKLLALVLAFALVLVSCGDDDSSTATTDAPLADDSPLATTEAPATEAPAEPFPRSPSKRPAKPS